MLTRRQQKRLKERVCMHTVYSDLIFVVSCHIFITLNYFIVAPLSLQYFFTPLMTFT